MFKVREWERFQFLVDYEHHQVFKYRSTILLVKKFALILFCSQLCMKHKKILERALPEALKLSIARKIENNLFSKVIEFKGFNNRHVSESLYTLFMHQISFLVGVISEIRTLFAAEVI